MTTPDKPTPHGNTTHATSAASAALASIASLGSQRTHPAAWLWLSLFVIGFDQVTKFLVTRFLELYERVEVLPVLDFTLLHNTGAAFSILADASGWQRGFFITLGLVVSAALIVWLWRLPRGEKFLPLALALIVGGAIGNVIDRIAARLRHRLHPCALGRRVFPGVQHRRQRDHDRCGADDPRRVSRAAPLT